jgi:hypothetical protein
MSNIVLDSLNRNRPSSAVFLTFLTPPRPLLPPDRGQFLHRSFTFRNGQLTSISADPTASAGYSTPVAVERIVVLGLPGGPAVGWTASLPDRPLTSAPGPVMMEPGLPDSALIIRKPELNIGHDFTLTLTRTK